MPNTTIININALKAGMHVVSIAAQQGPVKIRKSGMITSDDMVNGLKEMGVTELEVDLELSVALETDSETTHAVSQTKKLLMEKNARHIDAQMSEQFNRSLFLPSLQRMPSYSELLAKTAIRYVAVFLLGFTGGYAVIFGINANSPAPQLVQTAPVEAPPASSSSALNEVAVLPVQETAPIIETTEADNTIIPATAVTPASVSVQVNPDDDDNNASTNDTLAETPLEDSAVEAGRILNVPQEDATPSPEVAAAVANVIATLDSEPTSAPPNAVRVTNASELPRIGELPPFLLTQMPSMVFAQHMYSSVDSERYVRVNNRRLQEGDRIADKVLIENIEPQQLVLSINGTRFTMPALTDW